MEFNDSRLIDEDGWLGWFENGSKRLIRCHGTVFKFYGQSDHFWKRTMLPISEEDLNNYDHSEVDDTFKAAEAERYADRY